MKTKEIRDLIDFISQSGLNEVSIETEDLKIAIKRDAMMTKKIIAIKIRVLKENLGSAIKVNFP